RDALPISFEARELLDLGFGVHLFLDAGEHLNPQFLVHHLAAAEAQGDLHLVALFQEAHHRTHLDLEVVVVDARPQLDLLNLDHPLLLARGVLLLLFLIFPLAEIEDLADRRIGVGGVLHEDEPHTNATPASSAILSASRIGATPNIEPSSFTSLTEDTLI